MIFKQNTRKSALSFMLLYATTISTNANEYRFSLIDEEKALRTELSTKKPLENNYTGIVLKRLIGHFDQFKDATDWRSRTDEKFSSSVWGFISNEIVAAVTKESRHGITAYGYDKDPDKVMTYGEGYLTVDSYSGANWNALFNMNVNNQILYGNASSAFEAIGKTKNLLIKKYGAKYQNNIDAAALDIGIYMDKLQLYKYLAEERKHIFNITLDKNTEYLSFERNEAGELQKVSINELPSCDDISHITFRENEKIANDFKVEEHTAQMKYYTLDLKNLDTRQVTNMSDMFNDCSGLTSIVLSSKFNTTNVTNMSKMFCDCFSLTSLDLSKFDTRNVTDMSGLFYDCLGLTSLDLSNFDTTKVKSMQSMFSECKGLKSLDLSSFNTTNVENMQGVFSGCPNLTSLDLSNFNTTNVKNMAGMFYDCSGLTSLDISNFDTTNVTDMSSMFYYCSKLPYLDLSSFDTSNVEHMWRMFLRCKELKSLDLSKFDTTNVTDMSNMFCDCSGLASLDLSPKFNTANVKDMSKMFYCCSNLASLDLSSFNTAKVRDMSYMFLGCRSLPSLNLSGFDTTNVRDITAMFSSCRGLRSLDLPICFDTTNVEYMSYVFSGCVCRISFYVPSFNTTRVEDMDYMFK